MLAAINDWTSRHDLQLNDLHHKTEAIILSRKRNYELPRLLVGGHSIEVKRSLKYLGVTLDSHLTFRRHVEGVSGQAARTALALGRLMPNVGGPTQDKRALLMSVVNSRLFHAVHAWAEKATKFDVNNNEINRALRNAAIRIFRAYRTVFAEGAQFLAGFLPGDLLALEWHRIRLRLEDPDPKPKAEVKSTERKITINQWQNRWISGGKKAWTLVR